MCETIKECQKKILSLGGFGFKIWTEKDVLTIYDNCDDTRELKFTNAEKKSLLEWIKKQSEITERAEEETHMEIINQICYFGFDLKQKKAALKKCPCCHK